jgi:hypothetical protein
MQPALRAIGNILTTNDETVVDRCLWCNVLENLSFILKNQQNKFSVIKEACWAISNITACSNKHVVKFVESAAFYEVINLSLHCSKPDIKKETLWPICNAATSCEPEVLEKMLD